MVAVAPARTENDRPSDDEARVVALSPGMD
jgi:hypothetical protein